MKFLANFIIESDAIEGIQADPLLVKTQLEKRIDKGHVGALLLLETLAQNKETINENVICRVQGLITAEQHTKQGGPKLKPEYIGQYRLVGVSIGGKIAPRPEFVPDLMRSWVTSLVEWKKIDPNNSTTESLCSIAKFHYEYERIHPFADGNGRSGRVLVYYLLRYCGIRPFVFSSRDKHETYYRCFDEPEAMCKYFEVKFQANSAD